MGATGIGHPLTANRGRTTKSSCSRETARTDVTANCAPMPGASFASDHTNPGTDSAGSHDEPGLDEVLVEGQSGRQPHAEVLDDPHRGGAIHPGQGVADLP